MSSSIVWSFGVTAALMMTASVFADGPTTATSQAGVRALLWENTPGVVEGKETDTDPTVPTMDAYLVPAAEGAVAKAAVLVFPGGGYTHLSTVKEGKDVATMLNGHGISAFVVRYRHAPRYHEYVPLGDAQRAVRTVRSKAEEYHVDPHKIGVIGFSAGGHLVATLATAPDEVSADATDPIDRVSARPDFAALIYPVITMTDSKMHKGSRDALVGQDEKLAEALSGEKRVAKGMPPVFLVHAATDKTVPVENSLMFFEACHEAGVPAELHVFPVGPHGFGLAPGNAVLSTWPEMMVRWMVANKWVAAPAAGG